MLSRASPATGGQDSNADNFSPTMLQTARSTFAAASRLARASTIQTRAFIAPTVSRRADFVQELYLKELKSYKPTPVKESDSAGQVATFSTPKAPKSPEETDLAASLKEYETMAVEVEGQEAATAGSSEPATEDWLVIEDFDSEPPKH
ncbi:ATP synthase complex subunit H [Zalerion maritima]|uniref:ATP synthase complex subunit H n=1 Tax=Zalerion maritima TaxID=339359 RepID=A0AAD5RU96_9PEZI|nr:ATP synthase complex subunit H [Zalerion maritima]